MRAAGFEEVVNRPIQQKRGEIAIYQCSGAKGSVTLNLTFPSKVVSEILNDFDSLPKYVKIHWHSRKRLLAVQFFQNGDTLDETWYTLNEVNKGLRNVRTSVTRLSRLYNIPLEQIVGHYPYTVEEIEFTPGHPSKVYLIKLNKVTTGVDA